MSGEMEIATHEETVTSSASQLSEPVAHLDLSFSESTQSAIETTTVGVAAYHGDLVVVRCVVEGDRHAVVVRTHVKRVLVGQRNIDRRAGRGPLALRRDPGKAATGRSEEHTSELQSLMRISYAVFCLKKKTSQLTQ